MNDPKRPEYYGYELGEYGRIHFLLKMPSGWLVGVPEGAWNDGPLYIGDPGARVVSPALDVYLVEKPEETKEPVDDDPYIERDC